MYGASRQPWIQDIPYRLRFERGVKNAFPDMTVEITGRSMSSEIIYRVIVPVPDHAPRRLTIRIRNRRRPHLPRVFADGPHESPHRYSDGHLCMWFPDDPDEHRWVPVDGLLTLIRHAQLHLFREAHWRETDEWIGDEVPHGPIKEPRDEE